MGFGARDLGAMPSQANKPTSASPPPTRYPGCVVRMKRPIRSACTQEISEAVAAAGMAPQYSSELKRVDCLGLSPGFTTW